MIPYGRNHGRENIWNPRQKNIFRLLMCAMKTSGGKWRQRSSQFGQKMRDRVKTVESLVFERHRKNPLTVTHWPHPVPFTCWCPYTYWPPEEWYLSPRRDGGGPHGPSRPGNFGVPTVVHPRRRAAAAWTTSGEPHPAGCLCVNPLDAGTPPKKPPMQQCEIGDLMGNWVERRMTWPLCDPYPFATLWDERPSSVVRKDWGGGPWEHRR